MLPLSLESKTEPESEVCLDCAKEAFCRAPLIALRYSVDCAVFLSGLIHLLDYKPKTCEIDPANQLVVYSGLCFPHQAAFEATEVCLVRREGLLSFGLGTVGNRGRGPSPLSGAERGRNAVLAAELYPVSELYKHVQGVGLDPFLRARVACAHRVYSGARRRNGLSNQPSPLIEGNLPIWQHRDQVWSPVLPE